MAEAINDQVPLIWTIHGNLPEADLEMTASWEITPEYVKYIRTYRLKTTGEIAKQDGGACVLKGLGAEAVAQSLGG